MNQINMAFVDALEREKAKKQEQVVPQPQVQIDDRTRPLCDRVGHIYELSRENFMRCVFCGRSK